MVRRRFSAVSNHDARGPHPSRRRQGAAPQDEDGRNATSDKTERTMKLKSARPMLALVCALMATMSARAADVTYERLLNPDKEPHNWLMNHRDFGAQRYSPLGMINTSNVKNMRLLFEVALGR